MSRAPSRGNKFKRPPISRSMSHAPSRQLIKPLNGRITSDFGSRLSGRRHMGIDIAARSGQPIISAADGTVRFSGWRSGYGNTIIVQHAQGLKTLYAHNSRNLVRKGEKVRQGQVIALVGSTGRSTGPHLHFEVRNGSGPQNPLSYLS
jgi:murein DD-endopeptidase MepM/ murein hydrolase activator NlpD